MVPVPYQVIRTGLSVPDHPYREWYLDRELSCPSLVPGPGPQTLRTTPLQKIGEEKNFPLQFSEGAWCGGSGDETSLAQVDGGSEETGFTVGCGGIVCGGRVYER